VVTNNLLAELRGQSPRIKLQNKMIGDLVSLGQWRAIGYFFGVMWTGPIAWVIWRAVYLFKFASWPKRIKIALDWMIDVFYPRDITRA
jgi:NADH dehydrogenase